MYYWIFLSKYTDKQGKKKQFQKMVEIMVHTHKNKIITRNSIQLAYFNQAEYMSRQQEVYPMGYRPQLNVLNSWVVCNV